MLVTDRLFITVELVCKNEFAFDEEGFYLLMTEVFASQFPAKITCSFELHLPDEVAKVDSTH